MEAGDFLRTGQFSHKCLGEEEEMNERTTTEVVLASVWGQNTVAPSWLQFSLLILIILTSLSHQNQQADVNGTELLKASQVSLIANYQKGFLLFNKVANNSDLLCFGANSIISKL